MNYKITWKHKYLQCVVATTNLKTTNRPLSKLDSKVSYGNYKRTWQGVTDELLFYLYDIYMIYTNDK